MSNGEAEKQVTTTSAITPKKPHLKMRKFGRVLMGLGVILVLAMGVWQAAVTLQLYQGRIHNQEEQLEKQAAELGFLREEIPSIHAKIAALSTQWLEGDKALSIRLSEALYLIHLADHRLSFFRDAKTALQILRVAAEKISQAKDPNLQPIQEKLSKAVEEIQNREQADAASLSFKINQAIDVLVAIPASSTRATAPPVQGADKEPDWQKGLQQTWEKLKNLVTVKQLNTAAKPFLLPEEHALVLWNVRLELEQAKLAAWRGEEAAYLRSLNLAIAWIRQNLDIEQEKTANVLKMLEGLSAINWHGPKPNLEELASLVRQKLYP